jgi:hypothetical protein
VTDPALKPTIRDARQVDMFPVLNGVDACPECQHAWTRCVDSRAEAYGRRRRRECVACKHRWSTIEVPQTWFVKHHEAERVVASDEEC